MYRNKLFQPIFTIMFPRLNSRTILNLTHGLVNPHKITCYSTFTMCCHLSERDLFMNKNVHVTTVNNLSFKSVSNTQNKNFNHFLSSPNNLFCLQSTSQPVFAVCSLGSRNSSTDKNKQNNDSEVAPLSKGQKLKKAVTEYGTTVIVFHVAISLISLGICYVIISSGVDVGELLSKIGFGEGFLQTKFVASTGTFVAAYAVHKVLAPVRISITLGATPFIVRYLRSIGFLKKPN